LTGNLRATGDTPRALAASLAGRIGLGIHDAVIDHAAAQAAMRAFFNRAKLPAIAASTAAIMVRCGAFRLDVADGLGTVRALAVDSTRLGLTGEGSVSFADETLNLSLRTNVMLGPIAVSAPLNVGGGLRHPTLTAIMSPHDPSRLGPAGITLGAPATMPGGANSAGDYCRQHIGLTLPDGSGNLADPPS
jgi:AsmA protein